ncbi:MAG: glycosyltransferase family 9 protein [Chitinophagales bacterium]
MLQKILIIRFSSIGDIVLTTPVMRCLKKHMPHVSIHYATKKQYAALLESNPYVDKVHVFEDKKLPALTDALEKEKFDLILDLHNNLRTFLLTSNLNIPCRKFNKLNFRKWLAVKLHWNTLPDLHIVDRYLATLSDFGIHNDGAGLDHFIPQNERVDTASFPFGNTKYAALVIGALHATKKLPQHKLIALCNNIPTPIVLVGGPEDASAGDAIVAASTNKKIYNACGKYSLHGSASVIEQSDIVYTHDTGMMHIAAACKKNIISFWGNTIPAFGMYPYYGNTLSLAEQKRSGRIREVEGLSCRPCSKIGYATCPKGHFKCMELQSLNPA